MTHLTRQDLFNLEKYAEIRNEFRSQVMAHKKNRRLALNDHAVIYFEDRMTMQYQIQEMLRNFGFCEYLTVESMLKCLRLLNHLKLMVTSTIGNSR